MAARGEAGKALGTGIVFSFFGGLLGILLLMFIAPPLANIALMFGPYEYFSITVFALTMISGLSGKSMAKGLTSGLLGMGLALIGTAPIEGFPRLTFGFNTLDAGLGLLPVLIGLYAVSEMLKTAEAPGETGPSQVSSFKLKGFGFSLPQFMGQIGNCIRSSLIGTGIGILPGIGGGTSNIIAYVVSRKSSKHPEKYGTGIMDGLVASESANNASIGGALVPLLTLGIPGDTVTALLLGGLMIHGLMPGPLLFVNNGDLVFGIFAALFIANLVMLGIEFLGMRVFVRLLKIPKYILLPIIICLCVVGAFAVNNRMFDVWTLLFCGLMGYGLDKFGYPLPPVILGFILGPIAETNLRRGLMYSNGSFFPFLTAPISGIFLLISLISVVMTIRKNIKSAA